MSWFLSQDAVIAFLALLWLLLVLLLFRLLLILAKPQEGRPKKHQHRDNREDVRCEQTPGKGRCPAKTPPGPTGPSLHQRVQHLLTLATLPASSVLPETSQPSRTHCLEHPEMDAIDEVVCQFNRTIEDLTRYLEMLSCETPDGSESSWTSITASEAGSSSPVSLSLLRIDCNSPIMSCEDNFPADMCLSLSGEDPQYSIMTSEARSAAEMPLSPSREDPHSCIMASNAGYLTEMSLSPFSDDSWTSITVSDTGRSSQASISTLVDEADMDHAYRVQSDLEHPRTDPEEQPGPDTFPACEEELAICLEASSVQQQQQDLEILTAAPTSPPEVPEVNSRVMEMLLTHNKDLDTLESLIPESKQEQELGLPANVDETPQTVPASAPPTLQQPEKQDVMVVPIVQDLFFVTDDMKSRLEHHIYKMNIQRHYGLQSRILECEESFEKLIFR